MKKILAIITLTVVFGINSINATPQTQKSAIMGQLVDIENYAPITSAEVTINTPNSVITKNVKTDDNGIFELDEIPYGDCVISISYQGRKQVSFNISVNDRTTDMGIIEIQNGNNTTFLK